MKRILLWIILPVAVIALGIAAYIWMAQKPNTVPAPAATSSAPETGLSPESPSAAVSAPSNLDAEMGVFGLTIGESTLKDAVAKLGAAKKYYTDPGTTESPVAVCYVLSDPARFGTNHIVTEFLSGSAGGWSTVTDIKISEIGGSSPPNCSVLKPDTPEPAAGGLRLGMSAADVSGLLGDPAKQVGNEWTYSIVEQTGNTGTTQGINIDFLDGQAVQLEIYSVTTT